MTNRSIPVDSVRAVEAATKRQESFEEIGFRILNALIKFGKMELTKAQIQLLQKANPEKVCPFWIVERCPHRSEQVLRTNPAGGTGIGGINAGLVKLRILVSMLALPIFGITREHAAIKLGFE